jgi:hypothetical protein
MGTYEIRDSQSGVKSLVYKDTSEIRLHSAYNPVEEARRAAGVFDKGRSSVILVYGLGLGYHIDALKEKFPGQGIIVAESDERVIEIARSVNPGVFNGISLASGPESLVSILDQIDINDFRGVANFAHRPSYGIDPGFYDSMGLLLQKHMSSRVSDLLTRCEFEQRWIENILANIPQIFQSSMAASIFGVFKGRPGVIVSAGPSLWNNIDSLTALRDKALIVSVDTAAPVLMKRGISPHIVMTLDAQRYSIKHFTGYKDNKPALLADLVSYPGVLSRWTGRKIISSTAKFHSNADGTARRESTPFVDWLERYTNPVGDIQSGGSVATSAFDLLLALGCDPIILIGQDLAYTGREIHTRGTYHNDEWLPLSNRLVSLDSINQRIIRKRKIKFVEAYGSRGKVITDFVLDLYRTWFEDSAGRVSCRIINATEGGARIGNTAEIPALELASRLKVMDPSPEEVLKKTLKAGNSSSPLMLIKGIRKTIDQIKDLRRYAVEGLSSEQIESAINSENLKPIFNPFLRRARLFRSRYGDSQGDISQDEIIKLSDKIIKMMQKTLVKLEEAG